MAIRIGALTDSSLVRRKLGAAKIVLVASRDYLAKTGRPETMADLTGHHHFFVGLRPSITYPMRGPEGDVEPEFEARIAANDPKTLAAIVRAGNGIAALPRFLVADDLAKGDLEIVLPQYSHRNVEICAVYYGQSNNNPRIELFTSFLIAEMLGNKEL
jgi:LysR family transcriptional regulator, transcriptional activator for aaeXAB operon